MKRSLAARGWEVVVAEDGGVDLSQALNEGLHAVLLDLGMSGGSGMAVLQRLSNERPEMPVVVLAAHDDQRARRDSQAAGTAAFVARPFEVEALTKTLSRVIARAADPPR